MYEYRYGNLTEETIEMLSDKGIYPIQESFKGEGECFIIYYDETLPQIIDQDYISRTLVEETGWEDKWKEFIKPGDLTDNIRYEFDADIEPNENTILINPSMAFGTGTHPTTRCAAQLLEDKCSGKTVMDVGCGSGILALAASKRGAEKVYAFDIDPVSLINVFENIELNKADNISAWAGTIESFSGEADVVVANIITSVLNVIHPHVLELKPEYIVYSGILDSEYDEFIAGLDLDGYEVVESNQVDEWRGVLLKWV
jgi:ribosomal protein L11 methyltransferase